MAGVGLVGPFEFLRNILLHVLGSFSSIFLTLKYENCDNNLNIAHIHIRWFIKMCLDVIA